MNYRDFPVYKALYFDLKIKDLEKYYSLTNPKGSYSEIQGFLNENGFEHEQYSGYHSAQATTDMNVFTVIKNMHIQFPWLRKCVSKFEVTNIGENSDLIKMFPVESDEYNN